MSIKVITDSTSYLDTAAQRDLDITVIPLSVHFPDESFRETEVDYDYFYQKIEREGIIPTSSQPSQGEIEAVFRGCVEEGHPVLAIFISSDMSGTYQSAVTVKENLVKEYPAAQIEIIDSQTNCMAMGLMAVAAARAAQEGKSMAETILVARETSERTRFYFVPAGLEYLKKGGRIGGAAALLGSLLQIKPILYVQEGKTAVWQKARGQQAGVLRMLNQMESDVKSFGLRGALVHHISCPGPAAALAETIKKRYQCEVPVMSIGPVIGLHVGPGTLAIIYTTENR